MSNFQYPELSRADLISILQELQVAALTDNDLKNPVPEFVADIYTRLLVHLDLLNEEDQGQLEFDALEQLENPDHHIESVRVMNLYARIRELLNLVHCPLNFTLKDLLRPQVDRTEFFLGAIVNFCLHRDSKMNLLRPVGDELTLLTEQQRDWETKISELNEKIASLDAARQQELPVVRELDAKVKELSQTVGDLNVEQVKLRAGYKNLKSKERGLEEEIGKADFNLVQSVQENASLRSKIVQSPDKLQRALEEKKEVLRDAQNAERTARESFQKKTEIFEVYTKALKKMSKHFNLMQSIQEQVNSAKSIEKDYKVLKAKLSDNEVMDKSLDAKLAELQGKAQQLDELRKLLEKERDVKSGEATKNHSNIKLEVEAKRRDLQARQQNVESVLSEVEALTAKTNLVKGSAAAKVQVLISKREEIVKQFQLYKKSVTIWLAAEAETQVN